MTTEQEQTAREQANAAVERGYQWLVTDGATMGLDINLIEPGMLNLSSCFWCVLGQAGQRLAEESPTWQSGYTAVMNRVTPGWSDSGDGDQTFIKGNDWAREHGFLNSWPDTSSSDLTQAWQRKLADVRATATN